jgi:hypothetical protein
LLFDGTLRSSQVFLLVQFLETDDNYVPQPLVPGSADYTTRVEMLVSLLLSMPQWNVQ